MWLFIFKVSWEISCGEAFYFVETIQLICVASEVSGFCMVWVFTVENIRENIVFVVLKLINYHVM